MSATVFTMLSSREEKEKYFRSAFRLNNKQVWLCVGRHIALILSLLLHFKKQLDIYIYVYTLTNLSQNLILVNLFLFLVLSFVLFCLWKPIIFIFVLSAVISSFFIYLHASFFIYLHASLFIYLHASFFLYLHASFFIYLHASLFIYLHASFPNRNQQTLVHTALCAFLQNGLLHQVCITKIVILIILCLSVSLSLCLSVYISVSLSLTLCI